MGKTIISRDSDYADRIRKHKVMLNGQEKGKIGNGQKMEFEAPSGNSEIFLKIDWCRSNKIRFETVDDRTIYFECGSSLQSIKLLFAIIYVIFLPHKFLFLRETANH